MSQLTFRGDNRVFFAGNNPDLIALDKFEQVYGRDDTLLFVISAQQGDLFNPATLDAISRLTDQAWNLPNVKRVDSLTNFQRVQAVGDDINIDQLLRTGDPLSAADAHKLKQASKHEPLLIGRLVSQDGRLALVAVNFRFAPNTASQQTAKSMHAAQKLAENFKQSNPELNLGLSGSIALDNAFVEASISDSTVLLPSMVLVLLAVIFLVLRSAACAFVTFAVIALGTTSALGIAALLGVPLSSPSVVAPNIILTIACCDCIHICSGMMRLRRTGLSRTESVKEVLVECWWAVTLTSITTAIGFLSLLFSAVPPFAHLGIIVALGSLMAWLLSLTFLPALLCVLPWKAANVIPAQSLSSIVAGVVIKHPRKILLSVSLISLVLSGFAFTNTLDDRYVRYFDQRFEFRQATDSLNQQLGGFYTMEYSLDSGEEGGISNPAYLNQTEQFAQWLRQQPGVTHVNGLPDIVKTLNRAMNGGAGKQYRLPTSAALSSQLLALYEMSLPFGTDLKNQLTADKRSARLTVSLADVSTARMAELQAQAQTWAKQNTPLIADSARATGTSLLFAHIGNRNIHEMLKGMLIGVFAVWLVFIVAFRSLGLSLIGSVANLIPALVTLGIWALVNGEVGMAVATVASVTFGVVVDDTIHMLTTYSRLRRAGQSTYEAVELSFNMVGTGMITMTFSLAAGFACLAFSGFQINAWMGLMASITIVVALLFDLLFIPAILLVFAPKPRPDQPAQLTL
ncbi:RND family transporter [Pseudomonas sp. M30-35]|uniref:efflux RND transporter permease subunit n=1 Tax=Pseudomonas sp. M30-35 TaxID=1981174 RepID=UPI0015AE9B34|nr:MMPL family transporter [Pseudomonas sp. M30-35]